jgi:hypothetical protein
MLREPEVVLVRSKNDKQAEDGRRNRKWQRKGG